MQRLNEINPLVSVDNIINSLVPPPQFADSSFENYLPDPAEPTQMAAQQALRVFRDRIDAGKAGNAGKARSFLRRSQPPESRPGVYLDGGFGVGKTHLLAALWHGTETSDKVFGTFVEFTNIIGLLGFRDAVQVFARNRLVCIDEFELDDPGDTVLMSTFLGELVNAGVFLAATSNTLPDRLGEERFAADDFVREIQGLAARFDTIRIEGPDFRHRDINVHTEPHSREVVLSTVDRVSGAVITTWPEMLGHLSTLHPSHYGAVVTDIALLGIDGVAPLRDQVNALRFVAFVDRLYDRGVPVIASGVAFDQVFTPDMLRGGYRKKYFRCLSRLAALADLGTEVVG